MAIIEGFFPFYTICNKENTCKIQSARRGARLPTFHLPETDWKVPEGLNFKSSTCFMKITMIHGQGNEIVMYDVSNATPDFKKEFLLSKTELYSKIYLL